ncbi:hypothetical protein L195_g008397 [Trifolium pratense]|uniref:BRI1-KD interacting protein n=2 Tax=Trifolium pratense TaxID=57577 RepID=A0A2K3P916_TRIPR|nr:uncharacterized protein LOC123904976 [Trifolium pratense]PNY11782.1 hypothetical protein L195_g008397 [Trifolium pratense]CAJ2651639.1 unnamed protein product [Trifolium pratense]
MDILSPVNVGDDDDVISKLESTFVGSLHIQDDQELEHVSDKDGLGNCHAGEGCICGGFEQQETSLKVKSLKECSTFPYSNTVLPSCSASERTPTKLVSAMKGSRENHGGSQMKLSVKWSPDVYDPVPTLSSHTVRIKKQHKSRIKKSDKKYVKKGHKGNYSKGTSGKDKKQYHYKWPESCGKGFDASMELNNLDVVGHDSYHEISNSKPPATENPCHVGEALRNILDFVSYIKTA